MTKTIADRSETIAEAERRQWQKAADIPSELEDGGTADYARELADAIDELTEALERKESATESSTGEDLRDELASAWEDTTTALQTIADRLRDLGSAL